MPTVTKGEGRIPFPSDPARTAIVQMHFEPGMIANRVLPPTPPLPKPTFKYDQYQVEDAFTIPDTRMGRRSRPNKVEFSREEVIDTTEHHGLSDSVPQEDVDEAVTPGLPAASQQADPRDDAVMFMTHLLTLAREKRVADLVFSPDSYATGYKATLAGNSQWSHAESNPWKNLLTALSKPILRPNIVVFGQEAWTQFRMNKQVLLALRRSEEAAVGLATRQEVADTLEVDEILVGSPHINTAAEGQAAVLSHAWGKSCACLYRGAYATSPRPGGKLGSEGVSGMEMGSRLRRPTFGFTAVYRPLNVGSRFDQEPGIKGVYDLHVKESCKEVVAGNRFGYLLSSVVA